MTESPSNEAASAASSIDLALNGLSKSYGTVAAVDDVSLTVRRGEWLSLLGPSGCGKTTTLRMIAGFVAPSAGQVVIRGRDVTQVPPYRRSTGMVFQNYALFPHMTVRQNIGYGLRIRKQASARIDAKVDEMLAIVKLEGMGDRYPTRELSGGQQQRVALARALAIEPELLLLDEPLSNLDAKLREDLCIEMSQLQRRLGITTIYVTHDQEEALSMSSRIAVMSKGRIEQIGLPGEIYGRPATRFVAEFIGKINILKVTAISCDAGRLTIAIPSFAGEHRMVVPTIRHHATPATLDLAVRPEHVELARSDTPSAGEQVSLRGEVDHVAYFGDHTGYRVAIGPNISVSMTEKNRGQVPLALGETVFVQINGRDCMIIE